MRGFTIDVAVKFYEIVENDSEMLVPLLTIIRLPAGGEEVP